MRSSPLLQQLVAILVCLLLLVNCADDIRYRGTCSIPEIVAENQVIGAWQAEYSNFSSSSQQKATVNGGIERIQLFHDGTYVQTFDSPNFTYVSKRNMWRLVNGGDGPKLEMHGLRYFANGIETSEEALDLLMQTPDVIRFRDKYGYEGTEARTVKLAVKYPTDGFVYLYPRSCLGKFVLLQMVSDPADPDDPTVHKPVFERLRNE